MNDAEEDAKYLARAVQLAELPANDPRWLDAEGKHYLYTDIGTYIIINEPGSSRPRRAVCKIISEHYPVLAPNTESITTP